MAKRKNTTVELIAIGFCQPKFYKRHIWLQAREIMEWLCDHTASVIRCDYGRGMGKYADGAEKKTYTELAEIYDRYLAALDSLLDTIKPEHGNGKDQKTERILCPE